MVHPGRAGNGPLPPPDGELPRGLQAGERIIAARLARGFPLPAVAGIPVQNGRPLRQQLKLEENSAALADSEWTPGVICARLSFTKTSNRPLSPDIARDAPPAAHRSRPKPENGPRHLFGKIKPARGNIRYRRMDREHLPVLHAELSRGHPVSAFSEVFLSGKR